MAFLRTVLSKLVRSAGFAVALTFGLASSAHAALLQRDLNAAGDGLLAFDSDTGFEWLHFSLTANTRFSDIEGQLATLGGGGFRFATIGEVATLYTNAGIAPPTILSPDAGDIAGAQLLHDLLGLTVFSDRTVDIQGTAYRLIDSFQEGWVLPDDPADPTVYLAQVKASETRLAVDDNLLASNASAQFNYFSPNSGCNPDVACGRSAFGAGGYMLRAAADDPADDGTIDVPEPGVLPMLAAQLGLLALWRRRA